MDYDVHSRTVTQQRINIHFFLPPFPFVFLEIAFYRISRYPSAVVRHGSTSCSCVKDTRNQKIQAALARSQLWYRTDLAFEG
jgi:hypothetical protein